ncbi:MAG: hypothetical protein ACYDCN_02035 [Bacteroidia bacterium]
MKKRNRLHRLVLASCFLALIAVSCGTRSEIEKKLKANQDSLAAIAKQDSLAKPIAKTYRGYEIKAVLWPERNYYGKKATVKFDKLSAFFSDNFPKVFNDAITQKLAHTGPPSGIFFTYDEDKKQSECAAVISVPDGQTLKGWEKFNIPAADLALHIAYCGGYANMASAHGAMDDYMNEKGLTHSMVIEEYLSGPLNEKDSTKWLTNIYYVINGNGGVVIKVE